MRVNLQEIINKLTKGKFTDVKLKLEFFVFHHQYDYHCYHLQHSYCIINSSTVNIPA